MNFSDYDELFQQLQADGTAFVSATLVEAIGSTPQDAGAKMIVTTDGIAAGTVGGGRIEARAIQEAIDLLQNGDGVRTKFFEWNLQRDIGMTCGGVVKLYFELFNKSDWQIVIFGAGHVTQSLTRLLITLPCAITCIDPRSEWLGKLPKSPKLKTIQTDDPPSSVKDLPDDAFILSMTKGHASDFPVLLEIFKSNRQFPFLGVIGSKAKAAVLRRELSDAGISKDDAIFTCPVGLPIGTNHPGEIAISIAAQLLEVRDRIKSESQKA